MEGVMYCKKPMVDSGTRRAPAANSSSGMAVTGPLSRKNSQVCASCAGHWLPGPLGPAHSRATTARGARSMVSSDMPSSAPSVAVLRIRP